MPDFVDRRSVVRAIWGSPDLVLLVFAGAAAEFALNWAVDWLFFTGEVPADPFARLLSTARHAQEVVFADEQGARRALGRINATHAAVERRRGQAIPEWAHRDVLYMLVDYSERAHRLLHGPLNEAERQELYATFRRAGEGLRVTELPACYAEWRQDRSRHLDRDLIYSRYTERLYRAYRRHLGAWRYRALLQVQALLVPERVRLLLRLNSAGPLPHLARAYGVAGRFGLGGLVQRVLIPPRHWRDVSSLDRRTAGVTHG